MEDSRVVVITGGARGIGFACAKAFVDAGAQVVIADVDEDAGDAAAAELGEHGAASVRCDVGDPLSVHNLMAETLSVFGRIDVLVNNAGVIRPGDILALGEDDFLAVLRVNLMGAFLASQAAANQMVRQIEDDDERLDRARKRYAIVNVSSVNAVTAMPDQLAYNVSKGGLDQLTRAMALGLARKGVRVNGVAPGSVNTDVLRAVLEDEAAIDAMISRTPLGRIADPSEVAKVVVFLASEGASYMTGETVYVDGGRRALNMVMPPDD